MSGKAHFPKLFEPGNIGSMRLKNRILLPSMGTNFCNEDGYVPEHMKDYYEERAKGGAGLIIVEATCVESRVGKRRKSALCIDDDKFIPRLSELAQAIQRHGAKAAIQLNHAGRMAKSSSLETYQQPVAPSPIPAPGNEVPRELMQSEIADIVTCFAKAAERAQKAGFDGVEIHAAHVYLPAQFLSSATNKRQDDYGGNLRNRARFLIEIIMAIRELVGQSFPVWCRISSAESEVPPGVALQELQELSQMLQKSGVDAISVSGRHGAQSTLSPPGYYVHLAEAVKKVVDIPVIVASRISPELGEKILEHKKVDFIGIGRGLIADPELPKKASASRLDDIVPCIRCLECIDAVIKGKSVKCSVNAAVGNERGYRIKQAKKKKRVLVVGGGPAGMEAARVAALRGHQIILCEKSNSLGGQMLLAGKPPYKNEITNLTDYMVRQISKLGIKLELGKEVDAAIINNVKPDTVILATGVLPFAPQIPGISKHIVVTAEDVLSGDVQVGGKVAIVGGEMVGCETAMFLVEKGKKVIITRRGPEMAVKLTPRVRGPLLDMLVAKGVIMLRGVKYEEIVDRGLVITNRDGKRQLIEADNIVLAAGATPNRQLFNKIQDKVAEVYTIGDCVEPRKILDAIHEGAAVGHKI